MAFILPVAFAHPHGSVTEVLSTSFLPAFIIGILVGMGVGVSLALMWIRRECLEEIE